LATLTLQSALSTPESASYAARSVIRNCCA
jgi:hypothetical protein